MENKPKAVLIGLGGSIGSGKSVVREAFEALSGWEVIDSDAEAKKLYCDHAVRRELKQRLGIDPVDGEGRLDKALLTELLETEGKRETLEAVIHGALFDNLKRRTRETSSPVLLVESAILFTSGLAALCDTTIAVTAPREVRRERTLNRDRAKGEAFFEKMEARQEEERQMQEHAGYLVRNYGSHSIVLQTEKIITQILDNYAIR